MIKEFRDFIMRGNIIDLAVGFILGTAFAVVVTAFTNGILMALIAGIFGKPNFDDIVWHIGDANILIGTFITAVVNFLIIAAALFLILKAVATATRSRKEAAEDTPAPSDETVLLTEIRDLLSGAAGRQ
jgi:large conductance mechanosensitive channel